jgi:hypothetical protein
MDHLQKILILFLVAGIPAAAPPYSASSPDLCLAAGALTYRVSPGATAADLRVKIEPRAAHPDLLPELRPDLRIQLVDSVESADFAIVDDVSAARESACLTTGPIKTVSVVADAGPADITISLSRDAADADLRIFVHSVRFGHRDAAALFAAMRHYENVNKLSAGTDDADRQDSGHQEESW